MIIAMFFALPIYLLEEAYLLMNQSFGREQSDKEKNWAGMAMYWGIIALFFIT